MTCQAASDSPARSTSAPEDRFTGDDDTDDHAPIWSPAIQKALINWNTAKRENDDDGLKRAAREVVDATAGYYRMSGVPLFAHHPLPPQMVEAELGHVRGAPPDRAAQAVGRFADAFGGDVRRSVNQQATSLLQRGPALSGRSRADSARTEIPQYQGERGEGGPFARMAYTGPGGGSAASLAFGTRARGDRRVDQRTEQQIADDLDARDPIAAVAHPFAYGLDAALNDLAGEEGLLGDWGKRHVVPKPSGEFSGAAGEAVRAYLELGAPLGGVARVAGATGKIVEGAVSSRIGKALQKVLETRSGRAVAGGTLSVIAEWRANMDSEHPPTGWDYGISFLSGAITGGVEPRWGKAELDAGVAFGSSVLADAMSDRPPSVEGALAAGMASWLVTRAGGIARLKTARLFSQAGAKFGKKYFEKELKEYFGAMFGEELKMAEERWGKFWSAFEEHMRRQWQEFVERDDRDPLF